MTGRGRHLGQNMSHLDICVWTHQGCVCPVIECMLVEVLSGLTIPSNYVMLLV